MKKYLLWVIPVLAVLVVLFSASTVSFADTEDFDVDSLGFSYSYTDENAETEEDVWKEVKVEGDEISLNVADAEKYPELLYLTGAPEGGVFSEVVWKSDNELVQFYNYDKDQSEMEVSGDDTGAYPGQAELTVGKGVGEVTLTVTGKVGMYDYDKFEWKWQKEFSKTLHIAIVDETQYAVYVVGSDPETYDFVITKVGGTGASTEPLSYDVSGEAYPYDFCFVCDESKVPDAETFKQAYMDDMQEVYEIPSAVTWKSSAPKAVYPLYPKETSSNYMIFGFPGESGTATLTAEVNGKEFSFDVAVKYDNPEYYQFAGYSFFDDYKVSQDQITLCWDTWIYDEVKIKFGTSPETAVEIDPSEFDYDDEMEFHTYTASGLKSGTTYHAYMDGIIKIDGEEYHSYSNWDEFTTVPAKVTLSSVKSKARKLTVKWKKTTCAGYQIQVATNKTFKKGKKTFNVKGGAKVKYVTGKLKKGKKYFVRVRPYAMQYGEKVYGEWSNVRNVKCK